MKNLYRGSFSYASSVEKPLYRFALSKKQAWYLMCQAIAKKHEVRDSYVYGLFDGSRPNFEITVEMEYREGEDNDK